MLYLKPLMVINQIRARNSTQDSGEKRIPGFGQEGPPIATLGAPEVTPSGRKG